MVEIFLNNQSLELDNDIELTYTLQVNDIGDVATRQASYISGIKLPKTPNNTQILQGLGLVGDTSRLPYQKPTCQVIDDGFALIPNGWAIIKNTNDYYNLSIYNGIINFFKAIENKNLGIDLDLNLIDHQKNVQNVLNSFTNPNYRYLLGDYNGRTHYDADNKILIDYLPSSANVKYLWDLIFSTFGFTYSGSIFETDEFKDFWISYPKGVEGNVPPTQIYSNTNLSTGTTNINEDFLINNPIISLSEIQSFNTSLKTTFTALISISLDVTITGMFFSSYTDENGVTQYDGSFRMILILNNVETEIGYNSTSGPGSFTTTAQLTLNSGDTFSFVAREDLLANNSQISVSYFSINISKYNTLQSFSEELKDFKITDFVKEIMNKYCLTMFTNDHTNEITFKTIKERVETSVIIDWTDKYVERTNESYIFDTYAQKNNFRYNYNDKEDAHNDGFISIDNVNINANFDILKSITYSPLKETNDSFIVGSGQLPTGQRIFKQYDKDVKEVSSTSQNAEIKYKPLSKRFYFLHSKPEHAPVGTVVFGSINLSNTQTFAGSTIPVANFNQLDMNSIIGANYLPMQTILNDSRLHTIQLALSKFDVMTLNFDALYYFAQEEQYYLLNKINFKNNDYSTGEFVRVKR